MFKLFFALCTFIPHSLLAEVILLEEMVVEGYAPTSKEGKSVDQNEWLENKQNIKKTGLNREQVSMGEGVLSWNLPSRKQKNRFSLNLGNQSLLEIENSTKNRSVVGKLSRSRVSRSLVSSSRTLNQADDQEVVIKPKNDDISLIWNQKLRAWTFEMGANLKEEEVYSGEIFSGNQKQEGVQLDANYQLTSKALMRAGGEWTELETSSEIFLPSQQELREWQSVLGLDFQHSNSSKTELSIGRGHRTRKAGSFESKFRRDSYLLEHQNQWKFWRNRLRVQLLDEKGTNRKEEGVIPFLDSKIELSLYQNFSGILKGHYSHKAPTPKMLVGDGVRVLANPDLPNEEIRLAETGLKYSGQYLESSLVGFYGRSRHIPLWIGSAGGAARALSVGGAWMQGMRWRGDWENSAHKIGLGFTWQEILNDSSISWQKGYPLPGFARQKASVDWEWSPSSKWETQLRWERKWDIPLTLDGEVVESYRDTNYLGVLRKQKNYSYGLQLENFLISRVPKVDFAGGVGPNLLDRAGQGRVWRLVWEGSY